MRTLILLASASLAAGTVQAQGTAESRGRAAGEPRRAEADAAAWRDVVLRRFMVDDSAAMNRATLGLTLGASPGERDTLGVFVQSVVEGGPAERAGIYEGHRIAYIANVDVRAASADAGDPYLSGVGLHRLMRALRDVTPGSTVRLRVWTGSAYRDVDVTAARYSDVYRNRTFGLRRTVLPDTLSGIRPMRAPLRCIMPTQRAPIVPSVEAAPMAVPLLAPTPLRRSRYTI